MTPQEAINKINHLPIMRLDEDSELHEALKLAVEALNKQIPDTPDWREISGINGTCPCCGNRVYMYINLDYGVVKLLNYCQDCGQAIDWCEE